MPHALGFGAAVGAAGTGTLLAATNPVVAALGAANIGLYSLVYTPMKTKSTLNTPVGQVVGAIPPMMGYVAAAGPDVDAAMAALTSPGCLTAAALLFAWQGPHFYALSWRSRKDYARGGHMMESVVDPTGRSTATCITGYAGLLTALPFAAAAAGVIHPAVCLPATAVHAHLLYLARQFSGRPSDPNAQKVFLESLWYLPVMMALFVGGAYWQRRNNARAAAHDAVDAVDAAGQLQLVDGAVADADVGAGDDAEADDEDALTDTRRSKCVTGVSGLKTLCMHETIRETHVTPSCSTVEHAATSAVAATTAAVTGQNTATAATAGDA